MAREASNSGRPDERPRPRRAAWQARWETGPSPPAQDKVEGATRGLMDTWKAGAGQVSSAALTGARNLAEGKSPGRSMFGAGFAGLEEKVTGLFRKGGKGGEPEAQADQHRRVHRRGRPAHRRLQPVDQYSDFPKFTKKVENVDRNRNEENKSNWKAQIFWSHRTWEATVIEQVPDNRIIWRSKGQKGHVDGAVTFHELTPNLTRILLVLEYHPQGLFERTGNLWRAQGGRARLGLKRFRRHMMTERRTARKRPRGLARHSPRRQSGREPRDAVAREQEEGPQQSRRSRNGRADRPTPDDEARDTAGGREDDEARTRRASAGRRGRERQRARGRRGSGRGHRYQPDGSGRNGAAPRTGPPTRPEQAPAAKTGGTSTGREQVPGTAQDAAHDDHTRMRRR